MLETAARIDLFGIKEDGTIDGTHEWLRPGMSADVEIIFLHGVSLRQAGRTAEAIEASLTPR